MKLYSVKKGKYYFRGDKFQTCILQYALTLIGIVLAISFSSWLIALISFISFFAFYSFLQSETISDSIRVYFFQNCTYKLTENYDQVN